jgi:hypothetical protein
MRDTVIFNNRGFKEPDALPEARESGFIKGLLWVWLFHFPWLMVSRFHFPQKIT